MLISFLIKSGLIRWAAYDIRTLWQVVTDEMYVMRNPYACASQEAELKRSLHFARGGHYGKVIRALDSPDSASPGDPNVLEGLLKRHPRSLTQHKKCYSSSLYGRYKSSRTNLKS